MQWNWLHPNGTDPKHLTVLTAPYLIMSQRKLAANLKQRAAAYVVEVAPSIVQSTATSSALVEMADALLEEALLLEERVAEVEAPPPPKRRRWPRLSGMRKAPGNGL